MSCGCRNAEKCRIGWGDERHGTAHGYTNKGCRCVECAEAGRARRKRYRMTGTSTQQVLNPPRFPDNVPCKNQGDLFFPSIDDRAVLVRITNEAKKLCGLCPSFAECREWGIAHEMHGVWGGTTARERQKLRREQGVTFTPITYWGEPA